MATLTDHGARPSSPGATHAMRCLRDPDAFPSGDLIVKRALQQELVDPAPWASSRAYLTHCVWRNLAHQLSYTKGVPP